MVALYMSRQQHSFQTLTTRDDSPFQCINSTNHNYLRVSISENGILGVPFDGHWVDTSQ